MNISELNIDRGLLDKFYSYLEANKVTKFYNSMLKNLNTEKETFFLSSYCKMDYNDRDKLYDLYDKLGLSGTTYEQIYGQILELHRYEDFRSLVSIYPTIGVSVLELLYFKPESMSNLISQQMAEVESYMGINQSLVTSETIRIYLKLTERYKIFTSNFDKLYKDNESLFNSSISRYLNIEIAKRVVYLQKTIHQIKGTRICIIDTETTGLMKPKPIQISFILTDFNLNVIKTYNRYIKQESIERDATTTHGIDVKTLNNILPSIDPEDAFEEISHLLKSDKVIFIAHNANFDIRVLNNLSLQCTDEDLQALNSICTYKDYKMFSDIELPTHALSTLLDAHRITKRDISKCIEDLDIKSETQLGFHNSVVDVIALYLFVQKSKFFTNV